MSDGPSVGTSATSPAPELVIRFWTLVVIAKLAVLVTGAGILVFAATSYRAAGLGIIGVGVLIAIRWVHLYMRAKQVGEDDR